MRIVPMSQFEQSARANLSYAEILQVIDHVARNYKFGKRVIRDQPALLSIGFPKKGLTDSGLKMRVLYIVNHRDGEMILVDVQDDDMLRAWLSDPTNWGKLLAAARAVYELVMSMS